MAAHSAYAPPAIASIAPETHVSSLSVTLSILGTVLLMGAQRARLRRQTDIVALAKDRALHLAVAKAQFIAAMSHEARKLCYPPPRIPYFCAFEGLLIWCW
jgi:hypothetical protein